MNIEKVLYWMLFLISVTTIITGVVQTFTPASILGLLSAEISATTQQCFATVGMFMFIIGGLLLQVLLSRQMVSPVYLWAGLQKIGASIAVGLGVLNHVFASQALLIAGFDLLSGIIVFLYLRRASSSSHAPMPVGERSLT